MIAQGCSLLWYGFLWELEEKVRSWAIGNNPITHLISSRPPLTSTSDSACNLDEADAPRAFGREGGGFCPRTRVPRQVA